MIFHDFFERHARLRHFLKPSSFKVGCLFVILCVLGYFQTPKTLDTFIKSLDYRIVDYMLAVRGPEPTTGEVVVVDLDEKSLQAVGQWPWPRNVFGDMVRQIGAAKPRAVGFDIVFAEPDRTSPSRFVDFFKPYLKPDAQLPADALDNDAALGLAMKEAPTVLGYIFQLENDGMKRFGADAPFPEFQTPVADIKAKLGPIRLEVETAYRPILNVAGVTNGEKTEGFFNAMPDSSGSVRLVPLLFHYEGVLYPSLALEMLRLGLDIPPAKVGPAVGRQGLAGITLGDRFIPTDEHGNIYVNYRGPGRTFKYVSAVDVLRGRVQPRLLQGKYVLVGTSTQGLRDLRTTPFSLDFPGVEIHATVIDNVLQNNSFRNDPFIERAAILILIVFGGLLLTALLAFSGPEVSGIAGILVTVCTVLGNYYFFFRNQQIIGIAYPLLTLLAVFLVVTFFNYLFEGRQKRYIRHAFGRYLSPELVGQLAKNPEKLNLGGEEKELSVQFSDIRGFTTFSEQLTAHEQGAFLNEYLTPMTDIIMANKGYVDKYIGDAIMAIWGAPVEDDQHALHAVHSAVSMMARLTELRKGWDARHLPPVDIGIGINTGPMRVGNMGSEQRFNYTVMGDNVNQASRLEGLNKDYGTNILIAEATYLAVKDAFFCRIVDFAKPKGKTVPVKIYTPLCEGLPPTELLLEIQDFDVAFADYQAGRFADAKTKFEALAAGTGKTKQYGLYIERCDEFIANPPENWDGVYTFTHK